MALGLILGASHLFVAMGSIMYRDANACKRYEQNGKAVVIIHGMWDAPETEPSSDRNKADA